MVKLIPLKTQKKLLFIPFVNGIVCVCAMINYFRLQRYKPLVVTIVAWLAVSCCAAMGSQYLLKHYSFWKVQIFFLISVFVAASVLAILSYFYQRQMFKKLDLGKGNN